MFDLTSGKLLIVGIVALLVVGPKELPMLLRTIGKYVGIVKKQAAEFRAQFDEAMRESELDQIRKDVETITSEVKSTVFDAEQSVQKELSDVRQEIDSASSSVSADLGAHDVNGVPASAEPATPLSPAAAAAAAAGASSAAPITTDAKALT